MTTQDVLVNKWNKETVDLFKEQDVENGFFDVVFDVKGKKIFANKIVLARVSAPLKNKFLPSTPGSVVTIKIDYCYDDFFQLLMFLYSGRCDLSEENIVAMVQMAESFAVEDLLLECDEFLFSIQYNAENIFTYYEQLYLRKNFLFSGDELSNILLSANKSRVEVGNEEGHRMYGRICNDHDVINAIKNLQDSEVEASQRNSSFEGCFWQTKIDKPKCAILGKKKTVDYYLLINSVGNICVKATSEIVDDDDYLLAEMTTVDDFIFNNCKINIV
uniref:BTB domain-containing protein n=1 Tax=Panagrolaimus sp. ES5 TaxID=591445 RepID=A0AC34GQF5_9BILA